MEINGTAHSQRKATPLVSAIIPTRGRPELLAEALESVYEQEGTGEIFDLEVFVIYDAPADVSPNLKQRYSTARFLKQEKSGPSGARNTGIKASTGKYVAFLDDDNLWLPHKLKTQIPILESHPQVGVLYGQERVSGDVHAAAWPDQAPSGNVFEAFLTRTDDFIPTDTLVVRREAFEKAGYFDETVPTMEHYDLCLRLAVHFPFLFVRQPVAHGRFSRSGLWYTTIANGVHDRVLPKIVERALTSLPSGPESDVIRRKAHLAVFSTIAYWRWSTQGARHVWEHVLATLVKHPWMLDQPILLHEVYRLGYSFAEHSGRSLASVQSLAARVNKPGSVIAKSSEFRSVMWRGAAKYFWKARAYHLSIYVLLIALFHDPVYLVTLTKNSVSSRYWRAIGVGGVLTF